MHIYYYDPSPAGVSLGGGWMEDADPCPDCIEQGLCPRCGRKCSFEPAGDNDTLSCPHCEWDSQQAENHNAWVSLAPQDMQEQCLGAFDLHAIPNEPECFCHESVYDEYAELYRSEDHAED